MTDCRSTVSLWRRARDIGEKAVERYHRLGWKGKLVFWLWIGLYLFAGIIALVIGPNKVFAWFASLADKIRSLSFAWAIFVALSFPPMIGFGTAQTLVGFALSLWPGFLVAAASCLLGSALAFLVCRRLIRLFASSISRFPAFQALSQAVTSKGLLLIVLLRLCPLPFSYSNASFASIEAVSLPQFMLGTCVLLPKVFLYVFIGDRMYKFADPESRGEMDTLSKWLNATSIGVSAIVAVGASYYVYKIFRRPISKRAEFRQLRTEIQEELHLRLRPAKRSGASPTARMKEV
ncbi:Golgi apparatus membrane protein TVP38 [Rhodotorula toruloides]|nr:Golgi apparatus membrane protein TVP38 [Rhodotorula toruloides]